MHVRRSKISLWATLACLLISPALRADTQGADPCLSDERCESLYQSALSLSKAGQFFAALSNYRDAYARKPVPWLLINIGRVQQKMGDPTAAIASYQKFLDSPGAKADPELAMTARQYQKQAEQDLAKPKQPKVIVVKEEREPRPKWRLGVGGAMVGLGLVGIGIGAAGFAFNGLCGSDPIPPSTICPMVHNGIPAGLGFMVSGIIVAGAGATLMLIPGKRTVLTPVSGAELTPDKRTSL